jgi:hypothetical protein
VRGEEGQDVDAGIVRDRVLCAQQNEDVVAVHDDWRKNRRHPGGSRPVANRIVRWVSNISQGKEDTRQTSIKAEFIEGGTVGPAPEGID